MDREVWKWKRGEGSEWNERMGMEEEGMIGEVWEWKGREGVNGRDGKRGHLFRRVGVSSPVWTNYREVITIFEVACFQKSIWI